jgi:hypothetical protein
MVPTAVPAGAPTTAAMEPATPMAGPAGMLASAVTKAGPVGRWGHAAVVARVAARSREATAIA